MKVLFVHNNFPAQFRNVAEALQAERRLRTLRHRRRKRADRSRGLRSIATPFHRSTFRARTPFARRFDAECWRAEQVLMAASALAASGFAPQVILAHCGWGETLPMRAIYPQGEARCLRRVLLSWRRAGCSLRSRGPEARRGRPHRPSMQEREHAARADRG